MDLWISGTTQPTWVDFGYVMLFVVRVNIHHLICRKCFTSPTFYIPALPSSTSHTSISTQTQWLTCWINVVFSGPVYSGNLVYSTRAAMSKIWAAWAEISTKPSSWITLLLPTSSTLIMLWVLICFVDYDVPCVKKYKLYFYILLKRFLSVSLCRSRKQV